MKDHKAIGILSRQVELRLKDSQAQLFKIETVLKERHEKELILRDKIKELEIKIAQEKKKKSLKFLGGSSDFIGDAIHRFLRQLEKLESEYQMLVLDRQKAESRLLAVKLEIELMSKEKESLLRIEEGRVVDEMRIEIEKLDHN